MPDEPKTRTEAHDEWKRKHAHTRDSLIHFYAERFRRQPLIAVLALVITTGLYGYGIYWMFNRLTGRDHSLVPVTYDQQLKKLGETEASLKGLLSFIEKERQNIHENEKVLKALQQEQNVLKPAVEANRKEVAAVIQALNRDLQKTAWRDLLVGFAMGVFSSLVASVIYSFLQERIRRRRSSGSPAGN